MTMQDIWSKVDDYFGGLLAPHDPALDAALAANRAAGLPAIDVSALQGKFLDLLVRISGAKRILEIGTLGGYSTIWMARAAGPDGRVITLEASPAHADVARANLARAGLAERVELKLGPAIESLPLVQREASAPFDLVFIDADKRSNPDYLSWALRLSRPGSIIVVDNVVREGRVVDAASKDADIQGIRRFAEMLAQEPRLSSTALQTVGAKGYDGFSISVVLG
jgi:predicted O-methyltransferase YrrM